MGKEETENTESCCSCMDSRKLLIAGLVLGGAALLAFGIMSWCGAPEKRADKLLARAEKKVGEIENFLAKAS
jgi:hypothetical protein